MANMEKNYKKMANTISIEDAEVQYAELIADAIKKKLMVQSKRNQTMVVTL
jgi:hypothetical protein